MFSILRPYIFSLDPEVAHDLAIKSLKANFLPEFLTASINLEIDNVDKINVFLQVAKEHGIAILPPNINESESYFSIERILT